MSSAANLPGTRIKRGGFSRLWHTLKQLFHEVVGAVFGVLAFAWLNAAVRAWSRDAAYWLVAVAAVVGGLFLFFAFTSFQRSRKI
jgi:hypothetical protein